MLDQLFIHDRYAEIREIRLVDNNEPVLRVYRSSPTAVTIQIRTYSPTTESGKGKPRNMMANVHVGKMEIRSLIEFLEEKEKEFC